MEHSKDQLYGLCITKLFSETTSVQEIRNMSITLYNLILILVITIYTIVMTYIYIDRYHMIISHPYLRTNIENNSSRHWQPSSLLYQLHYHYTISISLINIFLYKLWCSPKRCSTGEEGDYKHLVYTCTCMYIPPVLLI